MSERRVHPRVKGPFEGSWNGAGTSSGRIVDLSVGGCFVESVSPPDGVGQRVIVSITASSDQIEVAGEVIYIEPGQGFAVRFLETPPDVVEILEREVASRPGG